MWKDLCFGLIAGLLAGLFTMVLYLMEGRWITYYEFLILWFIIRIYDEQ